METIKIPIPNKQGYYLFSKGENYEFVNPIEKISEFFIISNMELYRNFLISTGKKYPKLDLENFVRKKAISEWENEFKVVMSLRPHDNFFSLLQNLNKKDQIKALKGLSLTPYELMAFIFMAWKDYGYSYSFYDNTHYPTGLDKSKLPVLFGKDEQDNIVSIGNTPLSDGQIRQTIDQRKVIVVKFLDKDENWHCFFHTYRSLKGEESHKNGQPHLHYISNKWGLSREEVKERLLSKDGISSSVHIDYYTHRNPKEQ